MSIINVPNTLKGLASGSRTVTGEGAYKKYSTKITAVGDASSAGETAYTVEDVYNFTPMLTVVISGCTNSANNGTLQISRVDEANSKIYIANGSGVAETAPTAAVMTYTDESVSLHVVPNGISKITELLVSTTNQGANTYYYPSSTGLDMNAYKDVSFECELSANETLTFEGSDDRLFTTAKDITKAGYELTTNTLGNASFGGGTQNIIIDFDNFNMDRIRAKLVTSSATNSIKIWARRKA